MWPKWKWHGEFRDGVRWWRRALTFFERCWLSPVRWNRNSSCGIVPRARARLSIPSVHAVQQHTLHPLNSRIERAHREVAIYRSTTTRTFLWGLRAAAGPFSTRVPTCRVIFQEPLTEEFAWGTERSPKSSSRSMKKERLGRVPCEYREKERGEREREKKKKGPDVRRAGVFVECVPGIAGSYQYAPTPCYNKETREDRPGGHGNPFHNGGESHTRLTTLDAPLVPRIRRTWRNTYTNIRVTRLFFI